MADFEKRIFGPPDDTPILPWYEGAFSNAFVALHPFFKVVGLNPATCQHGTLVLSGHDRPEELSPLDWADHESERARLGKEVSGTSVDEASKRFGNAISWRAIRRQTGFADHRGLNRALRTHIGGLKREYCDFSGTERLVAHCAQSKIFLPTEGRLQPIMENSFLTLLRQAGLTEVVIADEFGDEEHRVNVDELSMPNSWRASDSLPLRYPQRIFSEDRSLLVAVHWDSFFTMVFGTDERLSEVRMGKLFEGFWCSEETTIGWLFEPCIPLVE